MGVPSTGGLRGCPWCWCCHGGVTTGGSRCHPGCAVLVAQREGDGGGALGPTGGPGCHGWVAPLAPLAPAGTRVYVRVSPRLRGRLAGLCGNFDGDAENDFGSRDGALEATPEIFGDSWRLSPLCPEADGHRPHPCEVRGQGDPGERGETGVTQGDVGDRQGCTGTAWGHRGTWGAGRGTQGMDRVMQKLARGHGGLAGGH